MLNGLISPILTLQSYQASPIIQILTMYALNVLDLLLFGSEALCALYSGSLNANCIVSTVQYNQQLFYSTYKHSKFITEIRNTVIIQEKS